MKQRLAACVATAAIAATIASCGGGTDGTGALPPPTGAVTSSGIMTKGSVILNGTHFESAGATVVDDRGRTAAQLDTGMVVQLRGRSDDGLTGVADRIDVENEARGAIQSIDATSTPARFTVSGLVVLVDDQTVFASVAGFGALAVGARVEVHGLRDSTGLLHASRVEAVGPQDGLDEVRGVVSNLLAGVHQFTLNGTISVDYTHAVFTPAGANETALAAGIAVQVDGALAGNVFIATQVEIDDLEDVPFQGEPGENQDVEGFISGFTAHPGVFQVNGQTVQTTATTLFDGGAASDLADDVAVEVDGVVDAQHAIVATKVEFVRMRVVLQGITNAVDVSARTVTVLGQAVQADDLTRIHTRPASGGGISSSLADLTPGVDCVEVRGHMQGATVVAEFIRELNQCNTPDQLQANVTAEDAANGTLSFFGSLVASLPVNAEFDDGNGTTVSRAAFLALVTPAGAQRPGTLVNLRGTFSAGTFNTQRAAITN